MRRPDALRLIAVAVLSSAVACAAEEPAAPPAAEHADDDHDHPEGDHDHDHPEGDRDHDHDPGDEAASQKVLEVNAAVRQNLGVTFAKAEKRAVERTLRLAGRFEARPDARRAYHALLPGTVEPLVEPLFKVDPGTPLVKVNSPELRARQQGLHAALHEIETAEAKVSVTKSRQRAARRKLTFVSERRKRLGQASLRRAEVEAERVTLLGELDILRAQRAAATDRLERERHHFETLIKALASVTGVDAKTLREKVPGDHKGEPVERWDTLDSIIIRAVSAGVVTRFGNPPGAWAAEGALAVEVVDTTALRFAGVALQSDLPRLRDGQPVKVEVPGQRPLRGRLQLGAGSTLGNARTYPVFVRLDEVADWARPGLVGFADVVVEGSTEASVAIPSEAIIRDGLEDVFFKRLADAPDRVLRVVAQRGASDGRWVSVTAELKPGDEVVLGGAYELKLAASSDSGMPKGHMHSDGSFHEDP